MLRKRGRERVRENIAALPLHFLFALLLPLLIKSKSIFIAPML